MRNISLFIFDLDGTLIDSKEDIATSVNYTMRTLGLPTVSDEVIYSFVGNGVTPLIRKSIEAAGGIDFDRALKIFMEHYDQHLLDRTRPFPVVLDVLEHFSKTPKVIVTNKSQGFSEKILKGLGMDRYFSEIFGGDTAFPKKPHPDVVRHLLTKFSAGAGETVIIGDSRVDIETGRNAGILTCGATWGFRPRQELVDIGCDYLTDRPGDLLKLFK